jgi:ribonucleoside-triphosphate reductase
MTLIEPATRTHATISDAEAARYADLVPDWGFGGLGYVTFKRTYARPVYATQFNGDPILNEWGEAIVERTEEWHETVQRVVNGAQNIGAELSMSELRRLYDYMFYLKGLPSGRALWQLGTVNNERLGGDSLVNCWFVDVGRVSDFQWSIERLMLGGGVGFSCDKPERLGLVRKATVVHRDKSDSDFIVPDKREGWGDLVFRIISAYLGDKDAPNILSYSTQLVREKGTLIHGFGGTASGPDILIEGVTKICALLDRAENRHLKSVEVLDIMNIIGSIVVAGNVRRSAEIALGDLADADYMWAKRWDTGNIPNERAMSNNSVYMTDAQMTKVTTDVDEAFSQNLWAGFEGKGEPYGFFNLDQSQLFGRTGESRPDMTIVGVNPCAEIPLADRESCNLAEINLPRMASEDELHDVSVLLYKVQKAIAAMPYLDRQSDDITSRNMRLGLGVTGIAQAVDKIDWLDATYLHLRETDALWSAFRGWPESVRLTCVKPSGTLSLLFGCTPGVHPGFSQFWVKGMRIASNHMLIPYCKQRGYNVYPLKKFDGTDDDRTMIVDFPCEFPSDTLLAEDITAVAQMDIVRLLQRVWADNAVSVTVYYKAEELDEIRAYLKEHWHAMKSVSFLLHDDHGFDQAPMREITEKEFIDLSTSVQGVGERIHGSTADLDLEDECASGSCPVR